MRDWQLFFRDKYAALLECMGTLLLAGVATFLERWTVLLKRVATLLAKDWQQFSRDWNSLERLAVFPWRFSEDQLFLRS